MRDDRERGLACCQKLYMLVLFVVRWKNREFGIDIPAHALCRSYTTLRW